MLTLALVVVGCTKKTDSGDECDYQMDVLNHSTLTPSAVSVFFTLNTCEGEGAPGFDGEDFTLYENGDEISAYESKQEIVPSSRGYDIATALLLDLSGSIVDSGNLSNLQDAAGLFLDAVGGEHDVAIYGFDGRESLQELSGFTEDIDVLQGAVAALDEYEVVDSSTNLNGAVLNGLTLLDGQASLSGDRMFMGSLAVFTDGTDQAGRISDSEATQAVSGTEHAVYSIGLGGEVDEQHLADIGVDGSWTAASVDGLGEAFQSAASSIIDRANSLYILAYCSPKREGLNKLLIELTGTDASGEVDFDANGFEGGCEPDDFLTGDADTDTDTDTDITCPNGMASFIYSTGEARCINEAVRSSSDDSDAESDCASFHGTAWVCTPTEIDEAYQSGFSWGEDEIMTTEDEGCCCPGPSNERGHECWEPTGTKCEWWPNVELHLCCAETL